MYVVVTVRPEVPPVAVIVFTPMLVFATVVTGVTVQVPYVPELFPVVHVDDAGAHMGVAIVTVSLGPNPETAIEGDIDSVG